MKTKQNKPSALFLCLLGMREKLSQLIFTEPENTQLLNVVLSAQMGLKDTRGEILPCPCFTPVQKIPASCNSIVSFVSIFERALVSFARKEVKTCPTSHRGNGNDFWAKMFHTDISVTSASAKISTGFLQKLLQKPGELSRE